MLKSIVLSLSILLAGNAYSDQEPVSSDAPPPPFELPTLTSEKPDFRKFREGFLPAKTVDSDALFNYFVTCYPARSLFNVDVKLKTGFSDRTDFDGQAGFYTAIVMDMPLFSSTENERIRNQEYKRRQDLAKLSASFSKSVTMLHLAKRKLSLYTALERREQLRVNTGIASVSDQVKYLDKIAGEVQNREEAKVEIVSSRAQLVAHCTTDKLYDARAYIDGIIREMD